MPSLLGAVHSKIGTEAVNSRKSQVGNGGQGMGASALDLLEVQPSDTERKAKLSRPES